MHVFLYYGLKDIRQSYINNIYYFLSITINNISSITNDPCGDQKIVNILIYRLYILEILAHNPVFTIIFMKSHYFLLLTGHSMIQSF